MSALRLARNGLRKLSQFERLVSNQSHFATTWTSCFRFLSTSATKNTSTSKNTKEKEKTKDQMDQLKSNPYFAKYEAKLKTVYK